MLKVIADYEDQYHAKGYYWPPSGKWQGNIEDTYYDGKLVGSGDAEDRGDLPGGHPPLL